jgi:hypothetical protein
MMKITVYVRREFIEHFGKIINFNFPSGNQIEYYEKHDIKRIIKDSVTFENAQRTHFQGWLEVQIDYETYIKLTDIGL